MVVPKGCTDSAEVQIRRLMAAQVAEVITSEECQAQVEILAHRTRLLHPIPLDEAVAKMKELARIRRAGIARIQKGWNDAERHEH